VERQTLVLQQTDRAHRLVVRSLPTVRVPVGIVQVCRTVDAEPDPGVNPRKEPRPILIEQHAIALEAMRELQGGRSPLGHERDRVLVPGERDHQGFTAMPRHLELPAEPRALEHAPANERQRLEAHARGRAAVREVTVRTIDIAKRRRLQNEQAQRRAEGVNADVRVRGHWGPRSQRSV
jgi:hypothetical protein